MRPTKRIKTNTPPLVTGAAPLAFLSLFASWPPVVTHADRWLIWEIFLESLPENEIFWGSINIYHLKFAKINWMMSRNCAIQAPRQASQSCLKCTSQGFESQFLMQHQIKDIHSSCWNMANQVCQSPFHHSIIFQKLLHSSHSCPRCFRSCGWSCCLSLRPFHLPAKTMRHVRDVSKMMWNEKSTHEKRPTDSHRHCRPCPWVARWLGAASGPLQWSNSLDPASFPAKHSHISSQESQT